MRPVFYPLFLLLTIGLIGQASAETENKSSTDPVVEAQSDAEAEAKAEAEYLAKVAESTLTEVGQLAPDFSLPTLSGEIFKLSDHRGEVVLLNFFATWCGPCKQEMPHLQKDIWEKHRADGLVVLSVSREEKVEVVTEYIKRNNLTIPFAVDSDRSVYAGYASGYIPRNYLIDRDGKILFQSIGFEAADFAQLKALIATELQP